MKHLNHLSRRQFSWGTIKTVQVVLSARGRTLIKTVQAGSYGAIKSTGPCGEKIQGRRDLNLKVLEYLEVNAIVCVEECCLVVENLFNHLLITRDLDIPSDLLYKSHLSRQLNCWSLRCSWSIACRRCSNCIFILDLTPGFNGLGKDNCKTRQESFTFADLVHLILDILW